MAALTDALHFPKERLSKFEALRFEPKIRNQATLGCTAAAVFLPRHTSVRVRTREEPRDRARTCPQQESTPRALRATRPGASSASRPLCNRHARPRRECPRSERIENCTHFMVLCVHAAMQRALTCACVFVRFTLHHAWLRNVRRKRRARNKGQGQAVRQGCVLSDDRTAERKCGKAIGKRLG